MKKSFFLLLTAILCFGCSKENALGDLPDIAKQNVPDPTVEVQLGNFVDETDFINDSYIEYEDGNGRIQTHYLAGMNTHFLNIRKNSLLTIHVVISVRGGSAGTPIYAVLSTVDLLGDAPVIYQDITWDNPLTKVIFDIPIVPLRGDGIPMLEDGTCILNLHAELTDFRSEMGHHVPIKQL